MTSKRHLKLERYKLLTSNHMNYGQYFIIFPILPAWGHWFRIGFIIVDTCEPGTVPQSLIVNEAIKCQKYRPWPKLYLRAPPWNARQVTPSRTPICHWCRWMVPIHLNGLYKQQDSPAAHIMWRAETMFEDTYETSNKTMTQDQDWMLKTNYG